MQSEIYSKEEVEGIGTHEDASWGDCALDSVLLRTERRTVYEVLERIRQGQYVMDPDFQREFVWDGTQQSKLIESIIMRIPLPVFYLAEDSEGRMVVVDGLQRLSTIKNFVDSRLELRLRNQSELNEKTFRELSPKLQNRIEDCSLTLHIIDAGVPERALLDIFERVNSGVPLTKQQMRNSLYLGPATHFLKTEAETDTFMRSTGGSLRRITMRDREFVNRFCGFQILKPEGYKGEMDEFLGNTLKHMNCMGQEKLAELSILFRNGLENNWRVFGENAFRRHSENRSRRSVINASLWDVMITGLSCYQAREVENRAKCIQSSFFRLMNNEEFNTAITYGTNDLKRVFKRFEMADLMFREAFNAKPA